MNEDDPQTTTLPPVEKLSKQEINELPLRRWEGPVEVICEEQDVAPALAGLDGDSVLGFDTETRPSFRKGVQYPPALLQLAGRETVLLFQLSQIGLPAPLRDLLSNPDITKAGVALDRDILELQTLSPFAPAGFIELSRIAEAAGIPHLGLRGMTACLLQFRISKGAQRSNWARTHLTHKQIRYAATDAWVGRELYFKLKGMGPSPGPSDRDAS